MIKLFLSYSIRDKIIAGKLKMCLEDIFGYSVFVAHSDLKGSEEFEKIIIEKIHSADIFVPLLSGNFKKSSYCDQETGVAVSIEKLIFPVKLGKVSPYGFIHKYQGEQYKSYATKDNVQGIATSIVTVSLKNVLMQNRAIELVGKQLEASKTKWKSSLLMKIVIDNNMIFNKQTEILLSKVANNRKVTETVIYKEFVKSITI